ncbi:hypothetical protein [Streptosporangium sp. 'caverna']|uniref:hypothetical protein n=1 Tax=Streptosporangium sp. 'caverna' TaxID=2202249 RepID=UPI0013A6D584|nr:hypothetical protein [Streptosporangium sp. 'caverna']
MMRREEPVAQQVSTTRRAAIIPAARTGPLALVWWWRYEIGLALCVPVAAVWAMGTLGWYRVVPAVALLALLVGAVPAVRAGVWGRIRCVFTAHRIRSGCVEALVVNRRGRVPHILWTAATPFGERAWLWCRTGTTVSDLEGATEVLAVCCLAQIVRITAHPRYPALAIVEVVREEKVWADGTGRYGRCESPLVAGRH